MKKGGIGISEYKTILLKAIPMLLLISFLLGSYLDFTKNIAKKRLDMAQHLALIESKINEIIIHNIDKMRGVATYVSLNTEMDIDELNYFVEEVLGTKNNSISNVGIFKDTTVVYLHPYEPNKSMKNINLAEIPSQKKDALRVKNKKNVVITPPVEIVQGGKGIMTRLPILLKDGSYWGQLGFMIKYDNFIEELGLISFHYKYLIKQIENDESSSHIVFDSGFDKNSISEDMKIEMPSSYWILSISYSNIFNLLSSTFYIMLFFGFITYFLSKKLIIELHKSNNELFYLSQRDELTGLQNRRSVKKILNHYNAAILFDIDDFKKINDELGHYCGDEILICLSKRVESIVRDDDVIVRWGGEEFLILMKIDKIETCITIANRIQDSMKKPYFVKDNQLNVTCSLGIDCSIDKSTIDMAKVISNADMAMYTAKKNGKDSIEVYSNFPPK